MNYDTFLYLKAKLQPICSMHFMWNKREKYYYGKTKSVIQSYTFKNSMGMLGKYQWLCCYVSDKYVRAICIVPINTSNTLKVVHSEGQQELYTTSELGSTIYTTSIIYLPKPVFIALTYCMWNLISGVRHFQPVNMILVAGPFNP